MGSPPSASTRARGLSAPSRSPEHISGTERRGDEMERTTLIVLAHPERQSFCGAWAEASAAAAEATGDRVLWSDLYGLGFDPAEGPEHYAAPPAPFDTLKAQEQAASGHLPADVAAEADKIRAADRIVFHFPLWWFAPPAMLKGLVRPLPRPRTVA